MKTHTKIVLVLVVAPVLGIVARTSDLDWLFYSASILERAGYTFLLLITFVSIPYVLETLYSGIGLLRSNQDLHRTLTHAIVTFLLTTGIAIFLGGVLGNVILRELPSDEAREFMGNSFLSSTFLRSELVRVIRTAGSWGILGLLILTIVSAYIWGSRNPDRAKSWLKQPITWYRGFFSWVLRLVPVAVFAIIFGVAAQASTDYWAYGALFLGTVMVGLVVHTAILIALGGRASGLGPIDFLRRIAQTQLIALGLSSANAALAMSMDTGKKQLGASDSVTNVVLPLGANLNMGGTALYLFLVVLISARTLGIDLGLPEQLELVSFVIIASILSAGVPGASIIWLMVLLEWVGIPNAILGLVIGAERVLDMFRTATDVTSDLTCLVITERSFQARQEWTGQKRFNWAAFLLTPVWLLFHRKFGAGLLAILWSVLMVYFFGTQENTPISIIVFVGISLFIAYYFGLEGNRIARREPQGAT